MRGLDIQIKTQVFYTLFVFVYIVKLNYDTKNLQSVSAKLVIKGKNGKYRQGKIFW